MHLLFQYGDSLKLILYVVKAGEKNVAQISCLWKSYLACIRHKGYNKAGKPLTLCKDFITITNLL